MPRGQPTDFGGEGFCKERRQHLRLCQVIQVAVNSSQEDEHMARVHAVVKRETKLFCEYHRQAPAGKDVKNEEEVAPVLCF